MFLRRLICGVANSRHVLVLAGALCLGLMSARPAWAQAEDDYLKSSPKVLSAFRAVVAIPSQSTVHVYSDGKEVALGTVVGVEGWILTKASELKGKAVCKFKDGNELQAKIVGIHERFDLALLKVEGAKLTAVVWGDSKTALPGNWVAAPGNGNDPVAVGVVSVATRKVRPGDLPPVNKNPGFLGVQLATASDKSKGAKITEVTPKSAAAKAGLQVNDVVIAVGDKTIADLEAMIDTIQRFHPGEAVTIRVKRDDKEVEIKATLDKRPKDDRSDYQNVQLGGPLSDLRGGFPVVLQHDTVLKPTECGGPLVDLDGKAIGINIARAGRVETYAVPAEEVLALLPDMKAGKFAPREKTLVKVESDGVLKAREALKKIDADLAELQKKREDAKKALEKAEAEAGKVEKK
jgi:serine protease Do